MQETNMLACLNLGMKPNLPPQARQRLVTKSPEWRMLEKPWMSLTLAGLYEIQIPNEDEDNNSSMMRTRSTSRSRRGVKTKIGPLQWLPEVSDVMIEGTGTDAYRLSVLLIRKSIYADDWEESFNEIVDDLRQRCDKDGVHPVWHKMAECTPILAQFISFPKAEISDEISDSIDMKIAWINPFNSKSLASALASLENGISNPTVKIALQKAKSQLNNKKGLRIITGLESLEGELSVISCLVNIHLGNDVKDNLDELKKSDPKLSESYSNLLNLKNGDKSKWASLRKSKGDDELTIAIKTAAWDLLPEEASKLKSKDLEEGMSLISDLGKKEQLMWLKLSALVREDEAEEALNVLNSLSIEQDTDITELISVVKKLGDSASEWLSGQIESLSSESLSQIINDDEFSMKIKSTAANRLFDIGSDSGIESMIEIFTHNLDLTRLSKILLDSEQLCADYPYSTLLVAHLLPASTKDWDFEAVRKGRRNALSTVEQAEVPESISSSSRGLLLMLDGASQSDDDWLVSTLDKNGIIAFNNCRQALKDGGDGLADTKVIENLENSVQEAKLSLLEARLFDTVVDTLKLNRASWLLQKNQSKGVVKLLDGLLSGKETALPMMQAVKHLVLEHDIGVPNLVRWFQENDPQSPWHTLARAAIHFTNKDELNAARDYKRAGDNSEFDYEHKILLYRKALIHFAHSEQWFEAAELLKKEPALKTALTKRFQLYLNVSNTASNKKNTEEATQMLKKYVKRKVIVQEEDQFGKVRDVERVRYSEEELDILRNYPTSHSRHLPTEPFSGRVKAAINSLHKERRRVNRHSFENRYAQAMLHEPSTEEIFNIATEASAVKPLEGLMLLERAQNSDKFSRVNIKRLAQAELSLFANHRHNLPVKQRTYLRKLELSPLVIIDTNILMDELHNRISDILEISTEVSLDVGGRGRFHRVLKHRANEGKIHLWIPKIVSKELLGLSKDVDRIRGRFSDTLVDNNRLEDLLKEDKLEEIAKQIVKDFSTWKPLDLHMEDESEDEEIKSNLQEFLVEHSEVYDEITAMKRQHSEPIRSVINNLDIYPEAPDQKIMCLATAMANIPLDEIGSILVATRDSDFALVARAVEERFGFGVIANSRNLNNWIN